MVSSGNDVSLRLSGGGLPCFKRGGANVGNDGGRLVPVCLS